LEKRYSDDLDIEDAIHTAILTLKDSFEGELTDKNIEIGVIRASDPNKEFKILSQSEIKDYLREVE
jgi:20S proteasome subunit alpha 2